MSRSTRFLHACRGEPTDCTPVWLMRQAGRYQPSYRQLRQKFSFFEICRNAELATQVTLKAVDELGADAAIIFSDILVPVIAMGLPVELTEKGPRLESPLRTDSDIERLRVVEPDQDMPYVMDSIRQTVEALDGSVPLIGFAGAPLTLASYMVEGGHSRQFIELKRLLFTRPASAHRLMDKLAQSITAHLKAQVAAGCAAVQVFDTWAGILSPEDYRELVLPHLRRIFAELEPLGVPRILFGTCTGSLLELMQQSGPDVMGIDWRVDLAEARQRLGHDVPIQGNLDPCCLLMDELDLQRRIADVLTAAGDGPGHIFNLGHGVLPPTSPERARFAVDAVHRLSANRAQGDDLGAPRPS